MKKRSIKISGHESSITLEEVFWVELRNIANEKNMSINRLVSEIDEKSNGNLSSAIRIYILQHLQDKIKHLPQ